MTDHARAQPRTQTDGLGVAEAALRSAAAGFLALEEHEAMKLSQLCRTADMLDEVQAEMDRDGVAIDSPQGQEGASDSGRIKAAASRFCPTPIGYATACRARRRQEQCDQDPEADTAAARCSQGRLCDRSGSGVRWLPEPEDVEPVRRGDVPWCGQFDEHDCLGAGCPRRPTQRDIGFARARDSEDGSDDLRDRRPAQPLIDACASS